MDLKQYLTSKYLFQINRVMMDRSDKVFLAIGAVLVILAVIFKLAAVYSPTPVDGKYRHKFYKLFLTVGLVEMVWYAARYYYIGFFGSHFVALLILLIGLVWLGFIVADMIKHYKTEKDAWAKEQVRQKYLPK